MTTRHRLTKLEASERAALIQQLEALEAKLSNRMTDDQLFAVEICLTICDAQREELLEMDNDDVFTQELAQRRQAKSLTDLRADVIAIEWAHRQWDEYEREQKSNEPAK